MKTVLFLCTGNYYRSRFAEELFNAHAEQQGVPWRAVSRALAIERGANNVGLISIHVLNALALREFRPRGANRLPQQCSMSDLLSAGKVIALEEREHRPLLVERFPGWADRVMYWHVQDVEFADASDALALIDKNIQTLVAELHAHEA